MPQGEVAFEGQTRGRSSIIGGVERERCPPPSFERRRRKERKERGALSCRPGSQIRRGLKSGVDCV